MSLSRRRARGGAREGAVNQGSGFSVHVGLRGECEIRRRRAFECEGPCRGEQDHGEAVAACLSL